MQYEESRHFVKVGHCDSVMSIYHVGPGPGVVIITAAFHARVRGSFPGLGGLKKKKFFIIHS